MSTHAHIVPPSHPLTPPPDSPVVHRFLPHSTIPIPLTPAPPLSPCRGSNGQGGGRGWGRNGDGAGWGEDREGEREQEEHEEEEDEGDEEDEQLEEDDD